MIAALVGLAAVAIVVTQVLPRPNFPGDFDAVALRDAAPPGPFFAEPMLRSIPADARASSFAIAGVRVLSRFFDGFPLSDSRSVSKENLSSWYYAIVDDGSNLCSGNTRTCALRCPA